MHGAMHSLTTCCKCRPRYAAICQTGRNILQCMDVNNASTKASIYVYELLSTHFVAVSFQAVEDTATGSSHVPFAHFYHLLVNVYTL